MAESVKENFSKINFLLNLLYKTTRALTYDYRTDFCEYLPAAVECEDDDVTEIIYTYTCIYIYIYTYCIYIYIYIYIYIHK